MPGAPGTALPNHVRWALQIASAIPRSRNGYRPPWPRARVETQGIVVTLAAHHLPYGTSAHHGARYAHLVRHTWIAWRRGRPVAMRARWWCGATCDSTTLHLTSEPAREICPMCQFTIGRAAAETDRP